MATREELKTFHLWLRELAKHLDGWTYKQANDPDEEQTWYGTLVGPLPEAELHAEPLKKERVALKTCSGFHFHHRYRQFRRDAPQAHRTFAMDRPFDKVAKEIQKDLVPAALSLAQIAAAMKKDVDDWRAKQQHAIDIVKSIGISVREESEDSAVFHANGVYDGRIQHGSVLFKTYSLEPELAIDLLGLLEERYK